MALDNLEKKVTVLQKRREEREQSPEKRQSIRAKYLNMRTNQNKTLDSQKKSIGTIPENN